MLITVISFNGLNLNSSDYETVLLNQHANPGANISFIEQPESDSTDADAYTVDVQSKVLSIRIKNFADRFALISQLKTTFKRGTKSELLVNFSDDGENYLTPCRVVNLVPDPEHTSHWKVNLQTSQTGWRAEELFAGVVEIEGEDSIVLDVGGDDETRLIADMVFTSGPEAGYINQAIYQLPNLQWALGTRPWCITLDTETIIDGDGMLESCDDLRVIINGSEVRRWIVDPNTDHTKIWFNVTLNRGYTFALKTAITNTDDLPTVEFIFAANSNRDLGNMPTSGILYHGSEWINYNNFNKTSLVATIAARGAFDTDRETHDVNDVFTFIQNVIVLQFGNSEATDPADGDDNYDDTKPMINLSDSDNLLWVWDATTGFYDPLYPGRTAQWRPTSSGSVVNYYLFEENGESGDPVMGGKLVYSTANAGPSQRVNGGVDWVIQVGAPIIDTVSTPTGKKKVDIGFNFGSNDPEMFMQGIQSNGSNGSGIRWTEFRPVADGTWHDYSAHDDVTLPSNYNYGVRFRFSGAIYYQAAGEIGLYSEVSAVSIAFDDVFDGAGLLEPKSNITLDLTIKNESNDDSLSANYPLLAGKVISIDSEESIVTYDSFNYHSAIILNDETRPVFIRLQPGENTIALIGAVGAGTITLSYYARRL